MALLSCYIWRSWHPLEMSPPTFRSIIICHANTQMFGNDMQLQTPKQEHIFFLMHAQAIGK